MISSELGHVAVMERVAADHALEFVPEEHHPAPALRLFDQHDDVVRHEDGLALRDHYPRGSFVVFER